MKSFVIYALVALATMAANAKTVGWWRFDDCGFDGRKTVSTDSFSNHVDAAKYPMLPRSFYNLESPATAETYMPSTTNVFGKWEKLRVYDPVSKTSHTVSMALSTTWGGNGSGSSGGAVIEDDPALRGSGEGGDGSFTWECFFRADSNALNRTALMSPILGQKSSEYSGCWSILLRRNSTSATKVYLWLRGNIRKTADGALQKDVTVGESGVNVTPDVWHHVAMTFDGTTGTFLLYLDYVQVATSGAKGAGHVEPGKNEKIYVGKGRYMNDRSFLGDIAEVRCSDACLAANQFLRLDNTSSGDRATDDSDVVAWYSLDSDNCFTNFFTANSNVRYNSGEFKQTLWAEIRKDANQTDVTYGGEPKRFVRAAHDSSNIKSNGVAAVFTLPDGYVAETHNPSGYIYVNDPIVKLSSDDFTEEFFFKIDALPASGKYYGLGHSSFFKILYDSSGHLLVRSYFNSQSIDSWLKDRNLMDGKYHHLAYVYDKSEKTVKAYLDYVCIATQTSTYQLSNSFESKTVHGLGQAREYNPVQAFAGKMDELRITRRALAPVEFLRAENRYGAMLMVK